MHSRGMVLAALVALCAGSGACSLHVERPRLQPRSVHWQSVDTRGVRLRLELAAYNPNTFDLPMRDLTARLFLEDVDTGSTVTNMNARLPAQREIVVTADVQIPWRSVPTTALTAITTPHLRFRIEGDVTVEHVLTVRAHFSQRGTIDRGVIFGSFGNVVRGVQNLINNFFRRNDAPPHGDNSSGGSR